MRHHSFAHGLESCPRSSGGNCSLVCCGRARTLGLITRSAPYPKGPAHAQWEGGRRGISYGANWKSQRDLARERDQHTCQHCGITRNAARRPLDVHHIVRFVDFSSYEAANDLSNLVTLCKKCHAVADGALYLARKAAGTMMVWEGQQNKSRQLPKWQSLGELVCLLARNWRVTGDTDLVETETGAKLERAIVAVRSKPTKSRGLHMAYDLCQATSLLRANTEIEADCWRFTLADSQDPDPRCFSALCAAKDNITIVKAERVAYLDWTDNRGGGRLWVDSRVGAARKGASTSMTRLNACGIGHRLPNARRRMWPPDEI